MSCRVLSLKFNNDRERENLLRYFLYKKKKISKKLIEWNFFLEIFLICRKLNLLAFKRYRILETRGEHCFHFIEDTD